MVDVNHGLWFKHRLDMLKKKNFSDIIFVIAISAQTRAVVCGNITYEIQPKFRIWSEFYQTLSKSHSIYEIDPFCFKADILVL